MCYSRLWNKHRGTLINFWTFFQRLRSLLERVMHIFLLDIRYLMVWGMPIFRAMLIQGATFIPESRVCLSFLVNIFTKSLLTGGVTQYILYSK